MEKRTAHEKEKYQPSYDTTILTEVTKQICLFAEEEIHGYSLERVGEELVPRKGRLLFGRLVQWTATSNLKILFSKPHLDGRCLY